MKIGIDTAFNRVNETGGIGGRTLKLIAADDGNEPARTAPGRAPALREGPDLRHHRQHRHRQPQRSRSPTRSSGRMLFFGALPAATSCAAIRPIAMSSTTVRAMPRKADVGVRYLVRCAASRLRQVAVFVQHDISAMPVLPASPRRSRTRYQRQRHPAAQLPAQHHRGRRGRQPVEDCKRRRSGRSSCSASLSGRCQIHRDDAQPLSRNDLHQYPGVGGSSLADELKPSGPRATQTGVLVTQVVPAVSRPFERGARIQERAGEVFSRRSAGLRAHWKALVVAIILIDGNQARRRATRHRKAGRCAGGTRNLDLGLGVPLQLRRPITPGFAQDLGHGARRDRPFPAGRSGISGHAVSQRFSMTRLWMARPK